MYETATEAGGRGNIHFYLAGSKRGKSKGASANISSKGLVQISYAKDWEHDAILAALKDAMSKAGYDPEKDIKFERYQPSYGELVKPHQLIEQGVLSFESEQLYLRLIPGLKERLKNAGTRRFVVQDGPLLVMGAEPVFEEDDSGRIIVAPKPEYEEAFYELQMKGVIDEEFGKKLQQGILRLLKKKFESAGLIFNDNWMTPTSDTEELDILKEMQRLIKMKRK
jgi:hypothetical protein